jgi:hypothetical protein
MSAIPPMEDKGGRVRRHRRASLVGSLMLALVVGMCLWTPRAPAMQNYFIGNGDYLQIFDTAETASLNPKAYSNLAWEKKVCKYLRPLPALKKVCSASGALQTIEKYQLKWFIEEAQRSDACAVWVLDYGHHGLNQFKKRWKIHSAQGYAAGVEIAIPWVDPAPAPMSTIRLSDPSETAWPGFKYINVTC